MLQDVPKIYALGAVDFYLSDQFGIEGSFKIYLNYSFNFSTSNIKKTLLIFFSVRLLIF